jgi:hypothetical protein
MREQNEQESGQETTEIGKELPHARRPPQECVAALPGCARPCPVRRHTAALELDLQKHQQGEGEIRMTRSRQSRARAASPEIIADTGDIVEFTMAMHPGSPLRIRRAPS